MLACCRRKLLAGCAVALLATHGGGHAGRVVGSMPPNLDVPQMLGEAETVVEVDDIAARLLGGDAGPPQVAVAVRATVSRVLKGDAELQGQGVEWRGCYPAVHFLCPNPFAATRGVALLRAKAEGGYELVDPMGAFLELPPFPPDTPPPTDSLAAVRAELLHCLGWDDARLVSAAAARLAYFPPDKPTEEALCEAVQHPDAGAAMTACWALIRLGVPRGIEAAVELLRAPPLPDRASPHARLRLIHALCDAGDDRSLQYVLALMKAPDTDLREAAARALGKMASPQAVQALGEALWDTDQRVRYIVITSLAEITLIRGHVPLPDLYRENEDEYLDFWRKWYAEVGKPAVQEPEGEEKE